MKLKAYRGHIRNWKLLCEELSIDLQLPRQMREEAILLKAYETWGKEIGEHLTGMFAAAFYDEKKEEWFCIRDPFGTKSFYYYLTKNKDLLVGTTIAEIMNQTGFVKEFNENMLQLYMSFTYTAGEDTFFKGIKKLMPGHYLRFREEKLEIERYFKPEFHPDYDKSKEEWADEIHNMVKEIMAEVKTEEEEAHAFLSSGVDSSYILAMSDAKKAHSCGYEDERFDESRLAQKTAELLGREHCRSIITPERYFESVPYVMKHMEQPLADASAVVFAIACEETAKKTKLCYSGEAADEFFGGYNIYRNAEHYGENLKDFYVGNTNIMKEDEKQELLKYYNPDVLPINLTKGIYKDMEGAEPLAKMSGVDIQIWLEGDIYLNIDKMSLAAGLEVRMPLTDLRIFDIASRIPAKYKVDEEQNKAAFRLAASKVLPKEIAYRKKLGFIVPIRIWMADDRYNQDVRRLFQSDIAEKFFHVDRIKSLFDDYVQGNSDLWRKVWTIYTFLVWYEIYFAE